MISTRFTELVGCSKAITLAPMAGVSGGNLAAAVTRGGGFAFIVAGHANDSDAEAFDAEVEIMKKTEKRRFGIGFIGHSSMAGGDLKRIEAILDRHQPLAAQVRSCE